MFLSRSLKRELKNSTWIYSLFDGGEKTEGGWKINIKLIAYLSSFKIPTVVDQHLCIRIWYLIANFPINLATYYSVSEIPLVLYSCNPFST